MTRYERVKSIIDSIPIKDRRVCPNKGGCACKGCVTVYGIREVELKLYNDGKL